MFPYTAHEEHGIVITSSDFLSAKYFIKINVPVGDSHFIQALLRGFPVAFAEMYLGFFKENSNLLKKPKRQTETVKVGTEYSVLIVKDKTCTG